MVKSEFLRIAVIGVGGIGSAFAFQLARTGGHDVTVIARPGSKRLEQLRADNGIIDIQNERADVHVSDVLDEQIPYDLIIVTILAHQVDAILPALQRSAAKWIQFMFNNFHPERLQDAVGSTRCSFGMPFIQSSLEVNGQLNAVIGRGGQRSLMSEQRFVDLFQTAGLPADFEPNMLLWLRCHAPVCIAFESVSVAGMRRNGGATWQESLMLAHGMQAGFTLIERLGFQLYPIGKVRMKKCPAWLIASMLYFISRIPSFRKLLATGIGECRALVDVMVAAAAQANPPIAVNLIQAMKPE